MKRVMRMATPLALAAVAAACGEPAEPETDSVRTLGVLQLEGASASFGGAGAAARDTTIRWTHGPEDGVITPPEVLLVPTEVEAGQSFDVQVRTIGESGCWSAESMGVDIAARVVELTPYDVHSGHAACTMILLSLLHESSVTLDEAGEWTVRVTGRRARYGEKTWETPVSAEKTIVVR